MDYQTNESWSDNIIQNLVEHKDIVVPVIGNDAFIVPEKSLEYGRTIEYSIIDYLKKRIKEKVDKNYQIKIDYPKFPEGIKDIELMTYIVEMLKESIFDYSRRINKTIDANSKIKIFITGIADELSQKAILKESIKTFLSYLKSPLIISTTIFRIKELEMLPFGYISQSHKCEKIEQFNEKYLIYYLFGLAQLNNEFVYTEETFLKFLHDFCNKNRGDWPIKDMSQKHLMTIGCDIPDWTFRFILYSLKDFGPETEEYFTGGVISKSFIDKGMKNFLNRIKYESNGERIEETIERINKTMVSGERKKIFASMLSKDYNTVGTQIKHNLEPDYSVWIFNKEKNDPEYWGKIKKGLRDTDYFMPIITADTLLELDNLDFPIVADKDKGIFWEWILAYNEWVDGKDNKRCYCIPFSEDPVYIQKLKNKLHYYKESYKEEKDAQKLWELFFPNDGDEAIIGIVTVEEVKLYTEK